MDKKADKIDGLVEGVTLRDWVMAQCVVKMFGAGESIHPRSGETTEDSLRRYWGGIAKAAAIAADAVMEESASHAAKMKKATE